MHTIYRFNDKAALHIEGLAPTAYLTKHQAEAIAEELQRIAKDIGECKFSDSKLGTVEISSEV